jgi:hypothetical protein
LKLNSQLKFIFPLVHFNFAGQIHGGLSSASCYHVSQFDLGTTTLPPTWCPLALWKPSRTPRCSPIAVAPTLHTCSSTSMTSSSLLKPATAPTYHYGSPVAVCHEGPQPPPPLPRRLGGVVSRRPLPPPVSVCSGYP